MLLSDEQWAHIEPLIPKPRTRSDGRGRPWSSPRLVFDGIVWILRTGAPWRCLPNQYPSYQTCHRRLQQWVADGTLLTILTRFAQVLAVGSGDEAFIDGTYVAARRGGDSVGKSRAGKTTKVMALADSKGLPLSIAVASGSRHDVVLTDRTLDACFRDGLPPNLIGDKAWDSAKLQRELREERGIELIAPKRGGARPSKRRQDGRSLRRTKRRWKVERLFAWIKVFRRLATRWEYKAENYLGFLHLGCLLILLRRL